MAGKDGRDRSAYYLQNREKILKQALEWQRGNKDRKDLIKLRHKLKKHGATLEDYITKFEQQNGCCAICRQHVIGRTMDIDHDHSTNKFRGLLCRNCNLGLGYFHDNPDHLNSAIQYINGNKS